MPIGYEIQAHLRLYEATKEVGIKLRRDLRTPNSKNVIARNVTPVEAMIELEKWEIKEVGKKRKTGKCGK